MLPLLFQKKAKDHELCIIKPELLSLLKSLEDKYNSETFQILNTLAVEYKPLIVADLEILKAFIKIIANLLKTDSGKILPELGRKWALRVLRWILVVDPEASDQECLKKCFLMAVPSRKFYLIQLEVGLEKIVEKITFYTAVRDDKIISILLDGFSGYFLMEPKLMKEKIMSSLNQILEKLSDSKMLNCLTDDFVANLVLESSSKYYRSLEIRFKKEFCCRFIDVFEFEAINIQEGDGDGWFIDWLSDDLEQFEKFSIFIRQGGENRTFLKRFQDEIIEIGRKNGRHSLSSYEKLK